MRIEDIDLTVIYIFNFVTILLTLLNAAVKDVFAFQVGENCFI